MLRFLISLQAVQLPGHPHYQVQLGNERNHALFVSDLTQVLAALDQR